MARILKTLVRKIRTAWRVLKDEPGQIVTLIRKNAGRPGLATSRPVPLLRRARRMARALDQLGHRDRLVALLESDARHLRATSPTPR